MFRHIKNLLIVYLFFLSIDSNAQIIKIGNNISMPLSTYRMIRERYYLCDSIINIDNVLSLQKDSIIKNKELIIQSKEKEIRFLQSLIEGKDQSISMLNVEANKFKNQKPKKFYIGIGLGYGATSSKLEPQIGLSIGYNLWKF